MVFLGQLSLPGVHETGVLVANFDIGSAAIKSNLRESYYWKSFLSQLSAGKTTWRIEGFSDCQGREAKNKSLRVARAQAVLALLPPALRPLITDVDGATAGDCITDNTNLGDRALNRSVAIILGESSVDMEPDTITDSLERKTPRTDGCSDDQRERMSLAYPMARRMGEHAMSVLGSMRRGSPEARVLEKFFGPGAFAERFHIKQNYRQALDVFATNPTYKCVAHGTDPCTGGTEAYVGAHAIIVGNPTIVCSTAFSSDVVELADTILHEATHLGAWTNDLEYCSITSGCNLETTDEKLPGIKLTDRGAVNNADSYGRFASSFFR